MCSPTVSCTSGGLEQLSDDEERARPGQFLMDNEERVRRVRIIGDPSLKKKRLSANIAPTLSTYIWFPLKIPPSLPFRNTEK